MQRKKLNAWLIAPALAVMSLTGCVTGVNEPLNVTEDFRNKVIEEIIEMGCDGEDGSVCLYPNTMEVIKDWVTQNEV